MLFKKLCGVYAHLSARFPNETLEPLRGASEGLGYRTTINVVTWFQSSIGCIRKRPCNGAIVSHRRRPYGHLLVIQLSRCMEAVPVVIIIVPIESLAVDLLANKQSDSE